LARHHFDIDVIAVNPIVRSIMMIGEPIALANSARSYMSSIDPAVTFM
jgi:hypothetical protein